MTRRRLTRRRCQCQLGQRLAEVEEVDPPFSGSGSQREMMKCLFDESAARLRLIRGIDISNFCRGGGL